MMRNLRATTKKAIRDLQRQRAQVIAVALTVLLGVGLFIASAGAFRNLDGSYQYTYDRLNFADVQSTGGDVDTVAAAARAAGADAVTTRTTADLPMEIAGSKLLGRVTGLPAGAQPTVGADEVIEGDYLDPAHPGGVLVERHAADTFGLEPGDAVRVYTATGWQRATVRGVVVSAEYLWPARSRQEVLSDPHSFAVLFAAEETARRWSGSGPNQVLTLGGERVAEAMRAAGAADVILRIDHPSHATLQGDLDGFAELSVAFPALFLTAAAIAAYVLLARRVLTERPVIGALMAAGARRGRLLRHYLLQGLLIGLLGAVAGVGFGLLTTGAITTEYTSALGIPDTIVRNHADLMLTGLGLGILIGLSGALAPALTAIRTAPATAMRNEVAARTPGWWGRLVGRVPRLPASARMALRDVFRSPRRTLATMLGSVLALVLVLASVGMLTSLAAALDKQFSEIERHDATVVLAAGAAVPDLPEIAAAEPAQIGQVTAVSGEQSYATTLQGLVPGTEMHGFRATSGEWISLPGDGVLAGAALADKLDIAPGDTLTLVATDGKSTRVELAGLLDEPLGTMIYVRDDLAAQVLPAGHTDSYLLRFRDGADRDALRQSITGLPGVLAYRDAHAVTEAIDQYLGLFWAFIGIMVLLGAILAFTVIYVTMAVNVVERTNELATLRAAGVSVRRVAGVLATESLVATALGLPLGLLAGVGAAYEFLNTFSSDLFHIELTFGWWALPAAAAGVLLAAALSQLPAARAIRRLDVARVVRERAG